MIKGILRKIISSHNNIEDTDIKGFSYHIPLVGESFFGMQRRIGEYALPL